MRYKTGIMIMINVLALSTVLVYFYQRLSRYYHWHVLSLCIQSNPLLAAILTHYQHLNHNQYCISFHLLLIKNICKYQLQQNSAATINQLILSHRYIKFNKHMSKYTSKFNSMEMPTAAKTAAFENSPYKTDVYVSRFGSPKHRSKLQQAKNTLSELIGEVTQKKEMNDGGVFEVRDVNIEALQFLGEQHNQTYLTPRKTLKGTRASQNYQSFNDYNKPAKSTYIPDFNSAKNYNDLNSVHYPANTQISPFYSPQRKQSAHNDQYALRTALDDQLMKNNELMKKMTGLEEQNQRMRRAQFSRSNQIPQYILTELDQLKEENEMLRKDTIHLLGRY